VRSVSICAPTVYEIFLRFAVRGHMYSYRLDSYRFNDTDARRHRAGCVRGKKTLRKTVTTTICQLNPFKRQHWYKTHLKADKLHVRKCGVYWKWHWNF